MGDDDEDRVGRRTIHHIANGLVDHCKPPVYRTNIQNAHKHTQHLAFNQLISGLTALPLPRVAGIKNHTHLFV